MVQNKEENAVLSVSAELLSVFLKVAINMGFCVLLQADRVGFASRPPRGLRPRTPGQGRRPCTPPPFEKGGRKLSSSGF